MPEIPASAAPRIRPAHWQAAVAVLDKVWSGRQPADTTLQAWFRDHRQMGARDRAHVGGLVYGVLRDAMRLQRIAGASAPVELIIALHALSAGVLDLEALRALTASVADTAHDQLARFDASLLSEAERHNVPDAIWVQWSAQYGAQAPALAEALNREAPVDLRVNLLKTSPELAQAALTEAGLAPVPTALSPWGLRLPKRAALQSTAAYREGWVEPQDEGSQLLAQWVDAQPGERVADFCAGAGGKTLALGATMNNRGELWALDIVEKRLSRIAARAQRAGLDIVQACVLPDAGWLAAHEAAFDAVLVDAPCSATGTWRRNPELRLRAIDFTALARQQREILSSASRLVRPGGRLIYATCSLMAAENEAVIADFVAQNPDFKFQVSTNVVKSAVDAPFLRLFPHRHGTDGFFAARMLRCDDT